MQRKIQFSTFSIKKRSRLVILKQHDAVFQKQLLTGIIEIVPESEHQDKNVHFIAHQRVIKKDRDTTIIKQNYLVLNLTPENRL